MVKALAAALKWVVFCLLPFYLGASLFICAAMWLTTGADSIALDWPIVAILCVPLAFLMAAGWSMPVHRSPHRLH